MEGRVPTERLEWVRREDGLTVGTSSSNILSLSTCEPILPGNTGDIVVMTSGEKGCVEETIDGAKGTDSPISWEFLPLKGKPLVAGEGSF